MRIYITKNVFIKKMYKFDDWHCLKNLHELLG